jgi:hypothetical protein
MTGAGKAIEDTGKKAETHGGHLREMHRLFHALNEVVPGLGALMQAAFSPVGAAISFAVIGFSIFREKIQEVNAELDKMAEENAKPATNRLNALREATVHAAEGLNNLEMKLAAAARSEQNMREATDKTITIFRNQIQAAGSLAEALKQNELAGLEEAHAAGLASEEQYAIRRLEIEQGYLTKKRDLQEREEMTEILIRRRSLENAEIAQPGLTSAAEAAELNKTKALEDLGSLDKGGVEERKKATEKALNEFETKYAAHLNVIQGEGPFASEYAENLHNRWTGLKVAATGAADEWQQFPRAEAQRKVAADRASEQASQAERAAVENQRFITDTGRDVTDRRARFDISRQTNQQVDALNQDTALKQTLAAAEVQNKKLHETVIEATQRQTFLSAELLRKLQESDKQIADLTQQVRKHNGYTPPP